MSALVPGGRRLVVANQSPSDVETAPRIRRPVVHLDPNTGKWVDAEPRWETLPAWLAAVAPDDGELDSWVWETVRRSAAHSHRREVTAWRLSPASLVRVVASQPLRHLGGSRYAPDGPGIAFGTSSELRAVDKVLVPAPDTSSPPGGRQAPPDRLTSNLDDIFSTAPTECRALMPPATTWRADWATSTDAGEFACARVVAGAVGVGWLSHRGGNWTSGLWAVVSTRAVEASSVEPLPPADALPPNGQADHRPQLSSVNSAGRFRRRH